MPELDKAESDNTGRLSDLVSAVESFKNGGAGVIVCMLGKENDALGHALVTCDVSDRGSGDYYIHVYDSNYPDDERRMIELSKRTGKWSYEKMYEKQEENMMISAAADTQISDSDGTAATADSPEYNAPITVNAAMTLLVPGCGCVGGGKRHCKRL